MTSKKTAEPAKPRPRTLIEQTLDSSLDEIAIKIIRLQAELEQAEKDQATMRQQRNLLAAS